MQADDNTVASPHRRCLDCDIRMVPFGNKPPNGMRVHHGRGLCGHCYKAAARHGRLDEWPAIRPRCGNGTCAFCQDTRWLADSGSPAHEWADRLGTTLDALSKRLYRHGLNDLANRVERIRQANRRAFKEAS